MDTLEQTRNQIIKDDIAVIEQTIRRLKLKRAKLLALISKNNDED